MAVIVAVVAVFVVTVWDFRVGRDGGGGHVVDRISEEKNLELIKFSLSVGMVLLLVRFLVFVIGRDTCTDKESPFLIHVPFISELLFIVFVTA